MTKNAKNYESDKIGKKKTKSDKTRQKYISKLKKWTKSDIMSKITTITKVIKLKKKRQKTKCQENDKNDRSDKKWQTVTISANWSKT